MLAVRPRSVVVGVFDVDVYSGSNPAAGAGFTEIIRDTNAAANVLLTEWARNKAGLQKLAFGALFGWGVNSSPYSLR
jgi:hypothetical protein